MKSAELSDDELIRGCRENNRKSQEMLYRRYARAMYNLCLVYESDRENAKDILQEGFIKIFRNISCLDRKSSVAGWMKKIITNTAIDFYRKNHCGHETVELKGLDLIFVEDESAASILNTEDIISQVEKLPEGARKIFQLHAIEGYSHREIARQLHISVGTCKSQIHRAKQLLQQRITGYSSNHAAR
jgi:RNA polymerase sigma-70 factor (ECF subfamily)